MTGDCKHTETCEDDVNAESRCATDLKEDTKRGEDDGENDFANITIRRRKLTSVSRCEK